MKSRIMYEYLLLIFQLTIGYDGCENNAEGLMDLVDRIKGLAQLGLEHNTKEVIFYNGLGEELNILGKKIKKSKKGR